MIYSITQIICPWFVAAPASQAGRGPGIDLQPVGHEPTNRAIGPKEGRGGDAKQCPEGELQGL